MKPPIIKTLMALALSMATAHAVIYSGTLSSSGLGADGLLTGTEAWENDALFSWSASDQEANCDGWYYTYQLTVTGKDISHVTTEVSNTFELSNLIGNIVDPGDILSEGSLDHYGPGLHGSSDPNIPAGLYGIKVDTQGDTKSITWSFCSDRVPVWGDMYAKDGKTGGEDVYLFNKGFNSNGPESTDTDPTDPASNGSIQNHILVPDSISDDPGPTPFPEPSTGMLGALGLMMIIRRRNR